MAKTFKRILRPDEVVAKAPPAPDPYANVPDGVPITEHLTRVDPTVPVLPDAQKFPWTPKDKVVLYNDSDDGMPGHYKRWSVWTNGKTLTTEWGRVGATMQTNTKHFGSEVGATNEALKLIRSKRAKGYRDTP